MSLLSLGRCFLLSRLTEEIPSNKTTNEPIPQVTFLDCKSHGALTKVDANSFIIAIADSGEVGHRGGL
jgi:hypothetical protein